jgi:hypothetical protein
LKKHLAAAARFVAVSGAAFAAATAWPWVVLGPPAWLAWLVAPLLGLTTLGPPGVSGPVITFARAGVPLTLEDPYVLAGIPLYLGLWAIAARPLRAIPWVRVGLGLVALEVVAGITLALVALCVDRGLTTSPAREPIELVALVFVAAIRVLPLPLWMMLDPQRSIPFTQRASTARSS